MSVGADASEQIGAHLVQVRLGRDERQHPCRYVKCVNCGMETLYDPLFERLPCSEGMDPPQEEVAAAALEILQLSEDELETDCGRVLRPGDEFFATLERTGTVTAPHRWRLRLFYDGSTPTVHRPPSPIARRVVTVRGRIEVIPAHDRKTGEYRATDVVVVWSDPGPKPDEIPEKPPVQR